MRRFCSCSMVAIVLFSGTPATSWKPKKPHISNPVKSIKKAEHSVTSGVSHTEKSAVNRVKKTEKTAISKAKNAGKSAVGAAKKAEKKAVNTAKKAASTVKKGVTSLEKGLEKAIMAAVKKLMSNAKFLEKLLDPALKAAKLPTFEDMKTTAKCVSPTLKDLKKLIEKSKNPLDPGVKATLDKIQKGDCIKEIATLADDCKGPGVLAATMTPAGGAVAGICGRISSVNGRINTTIAQIELAQKEALLAKQTLKGEAATERDDDGDDDEN